MQLDNPVLLIVDISVRLNCRLVFFLPLLPLEDLPLELKLKKKALLTSLTPHFIDHIKPSTIATQELYKGKVLKIRHQMLYQAQVQEQLGALLERVSMFFFGTKSCNRVVTSGVNRLFCMGEPGNEAKLYMTKATDFWRQQFLIGA